MNLSLYAPSQRYAGKACQYSRFRPNYPPVVVETFVRELGAQQRVVADIGSGTGLFSQRLIEAGFQVYAVEPNADMRCEAESHLGADPAFHSIDGTAEATTLPTHSIDALSCAQSFHWFDAERVIPEFRRILRPGAPVCLLWNNHRFDADDFHRDYESVLRLGCPDYLGYNISAVSYDVEKLKAQFRTHQVVEYHFDNEQVLDLDGLQGRISSVSYCPAPDSVAYAKLMAATEALFDRHERGGQVRILYDVEMYCIRFSCD